MAISALRLRRNALSLSSFIFNHDRTHLSSSVAAEITQSTSQNPRLVVPNIVSQFRAFRSSNISLNRPRTPYNNDDDMKIRPDEILFEGCDFNHWLITMDFPKDPKPSPDEMVETYVQTAAKVLGSVEEAKKKMYACSTTTYTGFQVQVSEDVSNKFQGLPGVVFVLPDSYIDPVNKQYGGDKYDNGIITPRPPPIQYGRTGGRFGDRNRDINRPPRGEYQQGNPAYANQGSRQGSAGNFGPPRNPPPQQNYGPPRMAPIDNSPGGQENYQAYRRDQMPPNQGNYNQGQSGNSYPQGQPPNQGNYNQGQSGNSYPQGQRVPPGQLNNNAPSQGGNFRQGADGNYGQGASGNYGQGAGGNYGQAAGGNYGQGAGGSYGQDAGGNYGQGASGSYGQGAGGNYGQGAGGNYGQGASGSYGQGAGGNYGQVAAGSYGQGAGGNYGQGAGGNYGQGDTGGFRQGATGNSGLGTGGDFPGQEKFPNYNKTNSGHGEDQRFSHGEQMNDLRQVQQ